MSELQFNGSYTVFTYMNNVTKSTIAVELNKANLESNIRSLHQNKGLTTSTVADELSQLILTKIQDKVLSHPEVKESLTEKGYDPKEKTKDYNNDVIKAIVPRLDEIKEVFSKVQKETQGSSWFILPSLSWIWSSST